MAYHIELKHAQVNWKWFRIRDTPLFGPEGLRGLHETSGSAVGQAKAWISWEGSEDGNSVRVVDDNGIVVFQARRVNYIQIETDRTDPIEDDTYTPEEWDQIARDNGYPPYDQE